MTIRIEKKFNCDNCQKEDTYEYFVVKNHVLNHDASMIQNALYVFPSEEATYCSMICLAESLAHYLDLSRRGQREGELDD